MRRLVCLAPCFLPVIQLAPSVAAQAGQPDYLQSVEVESRPCFRDWEGLSGDWGGARTTLADNGVSLSASFTWDLFHVASGGLEQNGTSSTLFDLEIDFDLGALAGLEGGTLAIEAYDVGGDYPADASGDFQVPSNFALAEHRTQIAQLWYEQWLWGDVLRFKLGKLDTFADFTYSDEAAEFCNTGVSWDPVHSPTMPVYPDPATGALLYWHPSASWALGLGVYDGATHTGKTTGTLGPATFVGAPQDTYYIGELAHTWSVGAEELAGTLKLGIAHHSGDFERFEGGTDSGTSVEYLVLDQKLSREHPDKAEDSQGWSGFLMLGLADPDVNEVRHHLSLGCTRSGWVRGRDEDLLGCALSWVDFSDAVGAGYEEDEVAVELFYKWQVVRWGSLKPDVQYIFNPGGDSGLDDALVLGLRVDIGL